ncbi:hypothetical protein A2W14_00880 [Candidatus Gottesmanbacteria bacterium RBG_16_37_8]|uniref:Fido domain-containing protein n=1 Tax=Candidatus Gottesmanbacteria bacterium RBG_16_37_8 TaxID=1798371 RepID=A0A1F5YQJ9_9BACT|nr:MAG: hypothetical protein A2W14_00880 [Candidatus Gottesmanbacteria bacterium RBG_16_37_8]
MNWQYVEIDEVYLIHQAIIKKAGTKASIRDFPLLHSAVERPKATYLGRDLYPTLFTKAAALVQSLCLNHSFTDGNKRTAWLSTKRFLHLNGYYLTANVEETVEFLLAIDNEKLAIPEITTWLKNHSKIHKFKT